MVRLMRLHLHSIISLDGKPPLGAGLALGGSGLWQRDLLMSARYAEQLPPKKQAFDGFKSRQTIPARTANRVTGRRYSTSCAVLACSAGSLFVHFLSSPFLIKTELCRTQRQSRCPPAGTWRRGVLGQQAGPGRRDYFSSAGGTSCGNLLQARMRQWARTKPAEMRFMNKVHKRA